MQLEAKVDADKAEEAKVDAGKAEVEDQAEVDQETIDTEEK